MTTSIIKVSPFNYFTAKLVQGIRKHLFTPRLCFQIFVAPSFDDKILEVVAVFGSAQLGISRVINLHHHRIAQVSTGDTPCYEPF